MSSVRSPTLPSAMAASLRTPHVLSASIERTATTPNGSSVIPNAETASHRRFASASFSMWTSPRTPRSLAETSSLPYDPRNDPRAPRIFSTSERMSLSSSFAPTPGTFGSLSSSDSDCSADMALVCATPGVHADDANHVPPMTEAVNAPTINRFVHRMLNSSSLLVPTSIRQIVKTRADLNLLKRYGVASFKVTRVPSATIRTSCRKVQFTRVRGVRGKPATHFTMATRMSSNGARHGNRPINAESNRTATSFILI